MDCSTPGLPVHHQLPEFAQTHVHWVGDAIQPSHPLPLPCSPALSLSQHQSLTGVNKSWQYNAPSWTHHPAPTFINSWPILFSCSICSPCSLPGFPGGSVVKKICLPVWEMQIRPWIGKIPWRRKWQPTPVFLPGKFHGQRFLAGYSLWGRKSWTRLSNWTTISWTIYVSYVNTSSLWKSSSSGGALS